MFFYNLKFFVLIFLIGTFLLAENQIKDKSITSWIMPTTLQRGDILLAKTRIDKNIMYDFLLEVLTIKKSAKDEYIILATTKDKLIKETGIAAGMSGSPVYYKGKLVGAVAFTYPDLKKPIAGITPIYQMLKIIDYIGKEPINYFNSDNKEYFNYDSAWVKSFSLDFNNKNNFYNKFPLLLWQQLKLPSLDFLDNKNHNSSKYQYNYLRENINLSWRPITLPITISGDFSITSNIWNRFKNKLGFVDVVLADGTNSAVKNLSDKNNKDIISLTNDDNKLIPGDYIGINFVRGDLDLTAFGTVTYVSNDTILAFGHAMGNGGVTSLPLYKARTETIIPSQSISFKVGKLVKEIGVITQDRKNGILGKIGTMAKYIPMEITLNSVINNLNFKFEIVDEYNYFKNLVIRTKFFFL
jgi:hypothetical protein